jgi:hypothetical protein
LPGSNFIRGSIAAAALRVNAFVSATRLAAGEGRAALPSQARQAIKLKSRGAESTGRASRPQKMRLCQTGCGAIDEAQQRR